MVYSDGFILDCANPFKVYSNETLQQVKNRLESGQLRISIFESDIWIKKIESFKNQSERDGFIYDQVMVWFQENLIKKSSLKSRDLPSLNPGNNISSVWFETEEQEHELFDFLDNNGLLSLIKDDILDNGYTWLFKVSELPTIQYDKRFIWREYLAPYAHYTKRLCIWDRYFFYSWSQPLSDLIDPFLELNPNLEIEIVSELDKRDKSYKYGLKNIDKIRRGYNQKVRFYLVDKEVGKRFHDRYMLTSYSLLKVEPGFSMTKRNWKSFRETTPTLVGRYAADNHKWENEYKQWDYKTGEYCVKI